MLIVTDQRRAAVPVAVRHSLIPAQRVLADGESLIDLSVPPPVVARGGRRPAGALIVGAVAVFLAGGVGYAVVADSFLSPPAAGVSLPPEVLSPSRPGVSLRPDPAPEVSSRPDLAPDIPSRPDRAGIPEQAADRVRVRESPAAD
ncbi:hypothetical protein [Paractinoplanes lichenicola]|uniref:Uncharacterized protein n=1 Tax=Paractinoplanes lichenicola TaxID=2802976 RepID=A0ABS1W5T4_9ACTN|nr:hypothetical protein [Actinoplanes lichenicola]MBL7261933.1 hypothetical protein [Actinoplanes lichenicola]